MCAEFQVAPSRIKHMFDIQNEGEWDWLINLFVHKVFNNIQQQINWLALKKKQKTRHCSLIKS